MKNAKLKVLVPSLLLLLGTMSCKDSGEKGNHVTATSSETEQQIDTAKISPDSTQLSPPTVTKH